MTNIQHLLLNLLKNGDYKPYIRKGDASGIIAGENIGYGYKSYSTMYIYKGKFWYGIIYDDFPNKTQTMFNEYNI